DLIAINLTETSSPSADITLSYSTTTETLASGAHRTYTSPEASGTGTDRTIIAERIWLASSWAALDSDSDIQFGKYGMNAYVAEIGHSLALSHPGTYDAATGIPTYAADAEY